MALIKCKECGHEVSDKATACPNCGCPMNGVAEPNEWRHDEQPRSKKLWKKAGGVLGLVLAIGAVAAFFFFAQGDGERQIALTQKLTDAVQKYDEVQAFHNGLALVVKDGKYGYINELGEETIPCQRKALIYRDGEIDESVLPDFSDGMALVYSFSMNEYGEPDFGSVRYGYINIKGEEVIPIQYKEASPFGEGLALVTDENDKQFFINATGQKVVSLDGNIHYCGTFHDGLIIAEQEAGYHAMGYADKTGKVVIPMKYTYEREFCNGLAYVQTDEHKGFIDTKGNEVISCNDYEQVGDFHEGLAAVFKSYEDMKIGFINKKGETVIPITLPVAGGEGGEPMLEREYFSDGLYYVTDENRYIDKTGKRVLDSDSKFQAGAFSEGLAVVTYGWSVYGFMDKHGNVTISDKQIKRVDEQRAEEQRKREEEYRRQQEEERRLAEQGPDWIQGTWSYSAFGMVSRVTINGRNIIYELDGSVQYNGTFEYRNGELHFGNNYIPVDESAQRLKASDTHYFSRSGSMPSSGNDNEELRIMARLKELGNKGKELTDELAQMRSRGQVDPMRYMFIKQNMLRYKDEQISLARKLGDSQMIYEYQQQKSKLEQAFRMIENGL